MKIVNSRLREIAMLKGFLVSFVILRKFLLVVEFTAICNLLF